MDNLLKENFPRINLEELNNLITLSPLDYISCCESQYLYSILNIVERLVKNKRENNERKIVLISGPSGSGKTTTAKRISQKLNECGHSTIMVSMDNYFLSKGDYNIPKNIYGEDDYESPYCVDIKLFVSDMLKLIKNEAIYSPIFDFEANKRSEEKIYLSPENIEFIIIEGIHALNPKIVEDLIPYSTSIYASVRTRIVDGESVIVNPMAIRLARRLFRDSETRNQTYTDTINRLPSVRVGELLNIMPYKKNADMHINTFIPYETSIYADILSKEFDKINIGEIEDKEIVQSLKNILKLEKLDKSLIPESSLLKEFISE